MGAWIEILLNPLVCNGKIVAPFMGAWIEISSRLNCSWTWRKSHPLWVRGLKLKTLDTQDELEESHPLWVRGLKSYAYSRPPSGDYSRTLYGCVDWNT